MYKQKLRKYITNCNGESEPLAAWPGESGLFNRSQESNPRHLLCYIVTRKLRFYKWSRVESEPQRAAGLLLCLAINCENIIGSIISKRDERYNQINDTLDKGDKIFAFVFFNALYNAILTKTHKYNFAKCFRYVICWTIYNNTKNTFNFLIYSKNTIDK